MMDNANKIVSKMYDNDRFSKWLGIEKVEIREGYSKLKMKIRDEMLNGFDIAHGGIIFSLADSALAFASNSYGKRSVSIEASISWPKALKKDDTAIAESAQKSLTKKTAIYDINITNQDGDIVGLFRGVIYRTDKDWLE